MFITREAVAEMEARHGAPAVLHWEHPVAADDLRFVRATQKHGRAHDVTLFIFQEDELVLIRKPSFPPGGFRAPSGGISPGEEFEAGALREAHEETGLRVVLEHYLLRIHVRFAAEGDFLDWTSHILQAQAVGGTLGTLDPHEIAEVRRAAVAELQGPIRDLLLSTGRPLLAYRVRLTDAAVPLLQRTAKR